MGKRDYALGFGLLALGVVLIGLGQRLRVPIHCGDETCTDDHG